MAKTKAYARIGFMGNPSDGYFGKTISCTIRNFCAQVTIWESPILRILPSNVLDFMEFRSLEDLREVVERGGYYGRLQLLCATCKKFAEYCQDHDIALADRNFTLEYSTNIPRQVGLGGSSAIITALLQALMEFYNLSYAEIPMPILPNLVLSVETEELSIAAGLQDRVAQVYGNTVYMDFSEDIMLRNGHGNYEYIDSKLMPSLFIAFHEYPSHSGNIHNDVRRRYDLGDPEIVESMRIFGGYAKQAKEALLARDYVTIAALMNSNFDLRRKIFSDEVIGERNIEMIEIARNLGLPAKFCGSGGAIVGMYSDSEQLQQAEKAYRQRGYSFVRPIIDTGKNDARFV